MKRFALQTTLAVGLFALVAGTSAPAIAQSVLGAASSTAEASPPPPIETVAREAYIMDPETGAVLFDKNGTVSMPPASMSKLMTIYILFERLKEGSLSLDDTFMVSENAWRKGGPRSGSSTMFLEPGKRVRVEDLIRGIIVQSGNDACIVVAEALAGTEEAFAEIMTAKGKEIGLTGSTFKNATGWPHPEHRMTGRDLTILASRTIADFPEYYHYYNEKEFTYNDIRQFNRNPLLERGVGVDGLKTGRTQEAGFGLTFSAKRGERRLVGMVNGLANRGARRTETARLLEWAFREFKNYELFKAGETVLDANVWLGTQPTVGLVLDEGVHMTLRRQARAGMKVTVSYLEPIAAPIAAGQEIAKLHIDVPGQPRISLPLKAAEGVERLGLFGRLGAALEYLVFGQST